MEIQVRSTHLPMIMALRNAELPPGVTVVIPPITERRGLSEAWAIAIFNIGANVPPLVIAALLIEKFKNKHSTVITINRKEVRLEKGEIIRIIEETTKIER